MLPPEIRTLAWAALVSLLASQLSAQADADPETVTRRVADAIVRDTSYGFRNRITGRVHPRAEDALVNTDLRVQSPYTEWHYPNGVIAIGMLALASAVDDSRYADYAAGNFAFIFDNLAVLRRHYGEGRPWVEFQRFFRTRVLDDCGAMASGLWDVSRIHPRKEYDAYFDTVTDHVLRREHRLSDGTFCRPSPRPECIWADDLYMSVPILARLGQRTGDARIFEDAVRQVERFHHYLWNEARGLYHHGYWSDEHDVSVAHWGRANGWIMMAKIELLKHLPVDHPGREAAIALVLRQVKGLARYQHRSGLWHQLLDRPDSFLETSASAMFAFGIARAVNEGWIDRGYLAVAEKAWQGIAGRVTPEGRVEGVCEGTGLRNDIGYYLQRTTPLNDRLGLGAVLLAGVEMIRAQDGAGRTRPGAERKAMPLFDQGESRAERFVLIPEFVSPHPGRPFRLDAFEIMTTPVMNADYQRFVEATGHPAPLHWKNGRIPEGRAGHPVIFVNRDDVDAYLAWLNRQSAAGYRLPTSLEFTVAAAGAAHGRYFWGDEETPLERGLVNFDAAGDRAFDAWEQHLRPADWGLKNERGLGQMAGNVWQLVDDQADNQLVEYKFRVATASSNERLIMGGSWASPKEYLRCGITLHQSPGLRHPDLGFRLVRDPADRRLEKKSRRLAPVAHPSGGIALSWSLLRSDAADVRFNVYRLAGASRPHAGFRLNERPLASTSFLDSEGIKAGTRYQYRVTSLDPSGREVTLSEWIGITAGEHAHPVVIQFAPLPAGEDLTPVFGDLEGWGRRGCVIRLGNGNREREKNPGRPVQLEAFSSTGRSLWRRDIAGHGQIYGNASNAAFNVWDMDGDGRAEVITLLQIGEARHLAILDGLSGHLRHHVPWDEMATDHARTSTRLQLSVACLDGIHPSIITMTGIYENEIISAYDSRLNKLWEYRSFMHTSGSGGHKIEVADVDDDGRQEVIYGTTCLNHDGTLRWSIHRQHPDIVSIADYLPDRPGKEICYIIESTVHAGIYLVAANTGAVIWKNNRSDDGRWAHGHTGWTSDIWAGSPGIECISNQAGHHDRNLLLFSARGEKVMEAFPNGYSPFEWDGDPTRELHGARGTILGEFNGKSIDVIEGVHPNPMPDASVVLTADLYGDFRTELVVSSTASDGGQVISVIAAPDPIEASFISLDEDLDYRLWLARNRGGGYGSIPNFELRPAGSAPAPAGR